MQHIATLHSVTTSVANLNLKPPKTIAAAAGIILLLLQGMRSYMLDLVGCARACAKHITTILA